MRPEKNKSLLDPHMEGSDLYGGVWGLKSLGFEGPKAVWSVWVVTKYINYRDPGCSSFV